MKSISALVAAVVLTVICGCTGGRPYEKYTCSGSVWSTTYSIVYISPWNLDDSIIAVMKQVEMSLSPFADSSLISRINRSETAATDTLLRRVFLASQDINRCSGGAFDPTLSPLINLWGFGYSKGVAPTEPSAAQIDSALRLVGIDRCRLAGDTLIKADPGMTFNFSAITKGYACDLIGEMFLRNDVDCYMVEIGGEIALQGRNYQGEKWHIQIDDPTMANASAGNHQQLTIVEISDCGIATSGNYRNYREQGGQRSWHTISPVTGRPAVTPMLSATVIAPDCMTADALATACMAMQPDSARAMIEAYPGASALFVLAPTTPADTLRVIRTSRFPNK
ncbi:MAG: FAD:protein FMN transferase [Bacteroides sp.]|nr:FAD:protein FMN transferase [Bacteroides sp.]